MNKACVNYGIEIPNDSKDKRIKRVIEDVTFKDSIKMSIVSTFFNEDKNKSFREFLFNNLEESEKTKHSIQSIDNLNNETISKINMNILKSLVKKYYNVEIKDIDNYNSKESNNALDGFQSHQARHKAKVYTATKVIEVYYGNAGNTTKLYEQVVNEVKKEFINNLCEPLIIDLAAADKNSGIKEKYIIQAKEIKDIYDKINNLQKELSEITDFIKKNNKSSNNEIRKQIKESAEKANNIKQNIKQLVKDRFVKISNLIKDLPVSYNKHKNYLALYNQIANNKSQWFTDVFRLKRLLPLKNIDNLLTEEEKLYQQTIEDETSFNNYENDESIDESAKTWTNTLLANYEQNIANDVKLFLSSLYELDAPIDGNEEISYSYDPDLGVRINMSAEHVIQQIYDHVNFHSIDEMINELETASKNIKSLYGLGTLVNKLRENTLLANRLYHELAQNRTSKIQVNIITNGIYARNSNEASKGKSKFIFDSVQSTLATFKSTYTAELYNKTIKNAGLTETEFNNKKKREKAINDFIEVFTSFVTNVKRSDIENYFYRSNLTYKEFNDMFNYLKEYLNKISALKSAYENVHDKYNEDYRKYKEAIRSIDMFRGLIPDNELEIPEKPKADYSSINYDNLYSSTIIEISNELFKTMAVDVQLNSLNAENNSSTDLLDNNKLQNLIKQISYTEIDADGNVTNKGLELLRDFVDSCDNYKYSNIFYGSGKTKGLFTKNPFGGPSIINKEAKDIIRLSLFDGISDKQNNKGIMYNKMTKGDYFVTQLQLFLSPINFYDNSHYDKAGYFMRTPSDAPKNFVIQTTRHKITDLFKNGVIDTKSDFFIAFRNIIYGELVDMMNAIKTLTVYDENGRAIIDKNMQGKYFEWYHYNPKQGVVEVVNGKPRLTGNVFKFMKLFETFTFNINESLINDISLYGENNTSILQIDGDNLIVNEDLVADIANNPFNYDSIIDENIIKWIDSYLSEINTKTEEYKHLIPETINDIQIQEAMLNYVIANTKFDDLFEGDAKFYADAQTFLKRAKEAQAGGKSYASSVADMLSGNKTETNSIFTEDFIDNHKELFEEKENGYNLNKDLKFGNGFKAITIKNTIRGSKNAQVIEDELYNIFLEEGYDETKARAKAKEAALPYAEAKTKVNDAQSYITIDEFIKRRYADGTLEQYLPLLEQIYSLTPDENGNYDASKMNLEGIDARIQVQKNFYYDINIDNDNEIRLAHPRQIKNAEFVLVPQLLPKDSDLRKLYDLMHKYGIDQVNTSETSKAAKKNVLTIWDNNGVWNENIDNEINDNVIDTFYYRYLYKQQEVAQHMVDTQNKAGIQVMKKILDNANLNIPEIAQYTKEFKEAYAANVKADFYTFIDRMGWEYDVENDRLVNKGEKNASTKTDLRFDKFYEMGLLEAQRLGLDSNFIDYLVPMENGVPIMPNYMSNVSTKLESIAQSMFNNNITRQKLPGWHSAQITNVGYSKNLKYHPEVKDENGNVIHEAYAEVLIPRWSNIIPKDYSIEKLAEESLDLQIGYRIPTEGKQSICILKVVGFLPDAYGSTIMVPDEWVTQTGSDFDVDSVYGIYNPLYQTKDENGNIIVKKVEPNLIEDEENTRKRYDIYIKNYLKKYYKDDYNVLKETPKELYTSVLYNTARERNLLTYVEFKELPIIEQQTKEQRNSIIVNSMIKILQHKSSREENYSRSNFDDITRVMKDLNKIRKATSKKSSSPYNPFDQIDFMENAMNGAILKAFSVTRDTFNSLSNAGKAELSYKHEIPIMYNLNENITIEELENRFGKDNVKNIGNKVLIFHNCFGCSYDNKNIEGKILTVYSSQTTAHILDAIKEGAIYNENTYTFGTFKTLLDIGSNYETAIAFLMQPGITEINNEFYKTNSVYINSYANPINNAIKNLATRLGLKYKNNGKLVPIDEYTSLEEVKKLLLQYKNRDGVTLKDVLEQLFNTQIKDIFDADNYYLYEKLLVNRLKEPVDSNKLTNIAIDLSTIILFNKIRNTTLNIEKLARCSNPDKFGAKQTIHETRTILHNIQEYSKSKNDVGKTLLVSVGGTQKPFLSVLYDKTFSFYPQMYSFYKYASDVSTKANAKLFKLEEDKFNNCFDSIVKSLGRDLTVDEYKMFKQYIVTAIYNTSDILSRPLTINNKGYITIDEARTDEYNSTDNGYDADLIEKYRVFGYNITEDGYFELKDFDNPTSEEIYRFNALTPAQKVVWVQKNFKDNSGIFDLFNTTIFNHREFNATGRSTNRISFNDNGKDIDDLIFQFDAAFNSKHPFIKLTAIDLIKYAFYVDGFAFKFGGISKIISNNSLLNFGYGQTQNIIDELNKTIANLDAENLGHIAERFIRSHSELIPNIKLKGTANTNSLTKAFVSSHLINKLYKFTIAEGNQTKEFINHLTKDGNVNPSYIRITQNINKEPVTTLFKVKYVTSNKKVTDVYLYPLNELETNEYSEISSNIANNEYRSPSYYESLIELNRTHLLSVRQAMSENNKDLTEEQLKQKNELKEKIQKLNEENKITKIKFNVLISTLNDTNNLIKSLDSNDAYIKAETKAFMKRINSGIARSKGSYTLIEFPGYKISEMFKVTEDIDNLGFVQYVLDENGEKYPVRITKTKLSKEAFKWLKGNNKIDFSSLPVEEQEVLADINKNKNINTNIYIIERFEDSQVQEVLNRAKERTNVEIKDVLFSSTSDIEYTDIYEYPELTKITKQVVDDILFNKRLNVVEERDMFERRVKDMGLDIRSSESIFDNTRAIFKGVNEYYKEVSKKLFRDINEFRASNGQIYNIGSPELYEYLLTDNTDYERVIQVLLEARTLGDNLKHLFDLEIDAEDKVLLSYINEIKDKVHKIQSNTSIKQGFENIFNIYFAKKYSSNPNIREGIVKMTESFGDATKADLLLSDIAELDHKQIQVVAKMVYTMLYEAESIKAPKMVEDFQKKYDEIMKEVGSIDFNKIIDKNGRFIQEYTQQFIEDRYKLLRELEELREDPNYGPASLKYLYKKLEFEKWKLANLEQPLVDDYYKEKITMLEHLYKHAGNLYSEYLKIKQEQNDPSAVLNDVEEERKRQNRYKNKIKALLSGIDSAGNIKSDKKLQEIEILKAYFNQNKAIQNKYFVNKISDDFKKLSEKHLKFIEDYKTKHPNQNLQERLENENYREAHEWLLSNGTFKFRSETQELIINAFSALRNTNNINNQLIKRFLNIKDRTDAFGIVDGRKFDKEEIDKIRELSAAGFKNPQNELTDATLIKDVEEDGNVYNEDYYDLFYSELTDEEKAERKQINNQINEILSKGVDENGHIDAKQLFEKCTLAELEELAKLYRQLRTYESGMSKEDMKYLQANVDFITNDAQFLKQYSYFQTNLRNNPKLKQLWREIFLEHEFDELNMYVVKLDESGMMPLANRFMYGSVKPKSSNMNRFIDVEKTKAKDFINKELLFEPTEYYYIAMDEAIAQGKYQEWFDANHVYNPYSRKYEPLSIWTTMSINPNSELAKDYVFTPNFDEIDTRIKDKYKNTKYNNVPKNYKKGHYDNPVQLNNKERRMSNFLQETTRSYVLEGKNKKFVEDGYAPAQYKIVADRDFYVNQALGVVGLDFRLRTNQEFYDKFDYRNDEYIDFPMLDFIKGKGFKELPKIPSRYKNESIIDYNKRIEPVIEERKKIEEENLKIHSALLERDWRLVFSNFIHNATIIETKNDLKNTMYLLLQSLKDTEAYDINNFNNVGINKHSTNETTAYNTKHQDNYYDITHNWTRRILFNQFKEKSKWNNTARLLQNITTVKYMALNLVGGVANINTGLTNIMGENFAKDYFGNKEFLHAQTKYRKSSFKFLADMYSDTSNDFYVASSKFFDVVNFDDLLERAGSGTLAEKIIKHRDLLYMFHSSGEHYLQNTALFAMMESVKLVKDENGKTTLKTYSEYINDLESNAIYAIIGEDEALLKAYKYFKSEIKQDANKKKKYDRFNRNIYIDFAKQYFNEKQLKEFIKIKDKLVKNAKIEFDKLQSVESQLELKNGKIKIKEGSDFNGLFGEFKIKVIEVNKKIHGVYDKYGAARLERKWYGSLVMQYHKHLYPGIMKRWRGLIGRGYYNEMRGSVEYGSYISFGKFMATEFRDINFKNEQDQIDILKGFQNTVKAFINTFTNISINWQMLPEWEKANIRRTLGDIAGVMSGILMAIAIYGLSDDDEEIKDSIFLSSCLYLADRLNNESSMYTPAGMMREFKTQYSNPLASKSLIDDIWTSIGYAWQWMTDDEFDINYKSGRYHGQNKIAVKLKRNIPFYNQYNKLINMGSNNQYYRIGDTNWNMKFAKKIVGFGEEEKETNTNKKVIKKSVKKIIKKK